MKYFKVYLISIGSIFLMSLFFMGFKNILISEIGIYGSEVSCSDYSGTISSKLIRFHVIANSDSEEDQRVKLLVRDAVLKELGQSMSRFKEVNESLAFLKQKIEETENVADRVLKENGKNYKSRAMIGSFDFPVKSYGNITLPPGKYTALRIVLGSGGGKNWWCVMFPPLCFIDITRGLTSEESSKKLGEVLNEKEINSITSNKGFSNKDKALTTTNGKKSRRNINFKFKSVEIIKEIIKKF